MSKDGRNSSILVTLPIWQVMLVLAGLPAFYMVNSLFPWSIGLLRRHDHAFFFPFWISVAVLHWISVALIVFLLVRSGRRLADIGLDLTPFRIGVMVGIPVVVGLALNMLHVISGVNHAPPLAAEVVSPVTTGERLFWILMSFTAGFCEEVVYRGFGIRVLQGRNLPTWMAVAVATAAFVLMHGISVLRPSPFLIIYIAGLLFSVLFLWRRSLVPGICLHTLIDLAAIGLPP